MRNAYPQWVLKGLIDLAGAKDPEVQRGFTQFIADKKRVGQVANYLPLFIADQEVCFRKLISLLEKEKGFEFSHVISGLWELGRGNAPEVIATLERRLGEDPEGRLWWHAKGTLIQNYSKLPAIRNAAILELNRPDAPLYAIAPAYANDDEIRAKLESLLGRLHEELRLVLVQGLGMFSLRPDPFGRNLLSQYTLEWNGQVRTQAALGRLSDGEIDRASRLPDVFEDDKSYGQVFSRSRLNADSGDILLCYKIQFRLQRLINEILDRGSQKYAFAQKARNLIWALLYQGMRHDRSYTEMRDNYGRLLTIEAGFTQWLQGIASTRVRHLLSDLASCPAYKEKLDEGRFDFLRTKAAQDGIP